MRCQGHLRKLCDWIATQNLPTRQFLFSSDINVAPGHIACTLSNSQFESIGRIYLPSTIGRKYYDDEPNRFSCSYIAGPPYFGAIKALSMMY